MVSSQLLWRFPNLLHDLIGEIRDPPPGKISGMTLNITTKVLFFNTESFRCHNLLHTKAGPRRPPGKPVLKRPLSARPVPPPRVHMSAPPPARGPGVPLVASHTWAATHAAQTGGRASPGDAGAPPRPRLRPLRPGQAEATAGPAGGPRARPAEEEACPADAGLP